jgi:hypothetical protein
MMAVVDWAWGLLSFWRETVLSARAGRDGNWEITGVCLRIRLIGPAARGVGHRKGVPDGVFMQGKRSCPSPHLPGYGNYSSGRAMFEMASIA